MVKAKKLAAEARPKTLSKRQESDRVYAVIFEGASTVAMIVEKTGLSRRAVVRALDKLYAAHMIHQTRAPVRGSAVFYRFREEHDEADALAFKTASALKAEEGARLSRRAREAHNIAEKLLYLSLMPIAMRNEALGLGAKSEVND